jgi:hypothetical protein
MMAIRPSKSFSIFKVICDSVIATLEDRAKMRPFVSLGKAYGCRDEGCRIVGNTAANSGAVLIGADQRHWSRDQRSGLR